MTTPTPSAATVPTTDQQLTATFYSELGISYETAYSQDPGLLKFLSYLLTILPPSSSVIDIGCGTGVPVAKTLSLAGHSVLGLDISDEMVRLSRRSVPGGTFEVADMQTWTPPSGLKVDCLMLVLSLFAFGREEIEAQVARLAAFVPVDGFLVVGTIAAEDMAGPGKSGVYDEDGKCARGVENQFMGHKVQITLLTTEGWRELLGSVGFEVVGGVKELFVPPVEARTEDEMHWFLVARRVRG